MEDDDSKAMQSVIDGMRSTARRAKALKYQPKLKEPEAPAPAAESDVSLADLEAALGAPTG